MGLAPVRRDGGPVQCRSPLRRARMTAVAKAAPAAAAISRGAGLLGHVAGGGVGRLPELAAGPVARVGAVGDAAAGEVLGLGRDVVYPRVHVLAQVVYAAVGLVQRVVGHVACGLHGIAGAVEDVVCGLVRRLQCFLGRGLNCHECVLSGKMRGTGVCLRTMRVRS